MSTKSDNLLKVLEIAEEKLSEGDYLKVAEHLKGISKEQSTILYRRSEFFNDIDTLFNKSLKENFKERTDFEIVLIKKCIKERCYYTANVNAGRLLTWSSEWSKRFNQSHSSVWRFYDCVDYKLNWCSNVFEDPNNGYKITFKFSFIDNIDKKIEYHTSCRTIDECMDIYVD